ncbi:uncharacterized protein LOC143017548 [Oratosquilla oratoria]|uniref:uncharacterized protein LOC143017548 n=1 Tax=Oratosquilla oratoria TaxID=337810 RepID=UPI003F77608B
MLPSASRVLTTKVLLTLSNYALESGNDATLPKLPVLMSQFSLQDSVLTHNMKVFEQDVAQLVIPESLVPAVLSLAHDSPQAGYPGCDKTLVMAQKKYYWPRMCLDIATHVAQCKSCAHNKGSTHTAPLVKYPTPSCLFHIVTTDLLQLRHGIQDSVYILVYVDHFSRFVILAPLH